MESNQINKRIIEKVRNRVVISNLESEENMKLNRKKQILALAAVGIFMITGSFITVNAATNGELADKIKDTIKVVFINDEGKEENVNRNNLYRF